jgi:hypothetical protein
MESLKNFVRYSWSSSPKVRTHVINDLIESLKTNQIDGKFNNQLDIINYLSIIKNKKKKIYQIRL